MKTIKIRLVLPIAFAAAAIFCNTGNAAADDEDIFAEYNKTIQKPADAKVTNVYDSWGENMANMIESGYRDGVVIESQGSYANGKIRVDGVGNVLVDKNANVGTIINKMGIDNSNIVIKPGKKTW